MKLSKQMKWAIGTTVLLAVAAILFAFNGAGTSEEVTPRQLKYFIDKKIITSATVTPSAFSSIYSIEGTFRKGGDKADSFTITTFLESQQLKDLLAMPGVKLASIPRPGARGQWVNVVPVILIAGLIVGLLVYQRNIGKGKSSQIKERPRVRFKDVAGVEEAKSEVQEVVDFLRNPKKYAQLGGKLPKGVLLVGPPGTGKTMLAKAIAGEAHANFFSAHGSDFNEIYVGVGAKRIRELFRQATPESAGDYLY